MSNFKDMLQAFLNKCNKALDEPIKNRHFKFGIPFLLFMTFGFIILREFGTTRYDFRKVSSSGTENLENLRFKTRPETLEEAYEKYKKVDIDNWKNIRGPRLWEEPSQ